jgi:hypothetical protein
VSGQRKRLEPYILYKDGSGVGNSRQGREKVKYSTEMKMNMKMKRRWEGKSAMRGQTD